MKTEWTKDLPVPGDCYLFRANGNTYFARAANPFTEFNRLNWKNMGIERSTNPIDPVTESQCIEIQIMKGATPGITSQAEIEPNTVVAMTTDTDTE